MLTSKDLSKPDISVPINVTESTPITIPRAVSMERILLANTADKEILKFSINREIIKSFAVGLPLFSHQTIG